MGTGCPAARSQAHDREAAEDRVGLDRLRSNVQKEWQAYEREIWPQALAREAEILHARRAVLQRYKAALTARMHAGHKHLAAAKFGAAARSEAHRGTLATYHKQLLGEIDAYAALVEQTAHRAAALLAQGSTTFTRGLF